MRSNFILAFLLCAIHSFTYAQSRINIQPKSTYVSDNLDLNAVENIYLESAGIKDFERKLNFPKYSISNLDLDNDNRVDYLRVVEKYENGNNHIIIQSVIGRNRYEDVAIITPYREPQPPNLLLNPIYQ